VRLGFAAKDVETATAIVEIKAVFTPGSMGHVSFQLDRAEPIFDPGQPP